MYETPFFSQKFTKGRCFLLNLNNKNEFKSSIKKRNYIALGGIFIVFSVLIVRLAYLQLTEGPDLAVSANRQYYYEEYTNNLTFNLLDNEGENLFNSVIKYYVVVDPLTFYTLNEESAFIDMRKVLYILRDYDKNYDISQLQSEMDKGSKKYEVDEETYKKIKELSKVKGIYAYKYNEYDKTINWNIKNILSTPFTTEENEVMKDEGSLEMKIYNYVKDNYKDKVRFEKDVSENIINEAEVIIPTNRNVKTTLNKEIQEKVEEALKSEKYKDYDQISAVLMKSSTGEILSMAQKNDWLPNLNYAPNTNGYYVGSIFKTIIYEAALEKGLVDENEIFDTTAEELKDIYPNSNEVLGRYTIKQAYTISSNKSFYLIGMRVGVDNMYRLANLQGLFNPVLGLHREAVGSLERYGEVENGPSITNTSIGQTVRSTPLGALAIANTVVNDGIYVKPYILDSIVQNDGTVVEKFTTETNKVISDYTAGVLKDAMINVVDAELGSGRNAKVTGIEIGGKTGTTEIGKENEESDVWFSGFFNYKGEYYTMVVYIPHSDKVEKMSSSVACSVFKDIVEGITEKGFLQ